MAKKTETAPVLERDVEEIHVKWDRSVDDRDRGYKRGTDSGGRTIEINRDDGTRYGTVHINGVLKYMGAPDPVAHLQRMRGCHRFVIVGA